MSQHTESFHLWRSSYGQAKRLLATIGVDGTVYKETNHWTTIIPTDENNSHVANFSSRYPGIVLHYLYDEDYAWMANLFIKGELRSSFVYMASPENCVQDELLDIEAFYPFLISPDHQSEFKMIFQLDDFEDIFEVNPAYRFTQLLGIKHHHCTTKQYYPTLRLNLKPHHRVTAGM